MLNTRRGYGIPEYLLGGLSAAIVVVSYLFGFTGLGIALAVSLLALLLSSALVRADRQVSLGKSLSGSTLALLWVPLMLGIAMVYFQTDHGERGILMILLMAICNDTFGFIAGVNWGKHPMAPKISRRKAGRVWLVPSSVRQLLALSPWRSWVRPGIGLFRWRRSWWSRRLPVTWWSPCSSAVWV